MANFVKNSVDPLSFFKVDAGQDLFEEKRSLGISSIAFKIVTGGNEGILVLENTFYARGGPSKHLHFDQDEWFYAIEGNFIFEVGDEKLTLKPGDSLMAARKVSHVWAYTGNETGTQGRILVAFFPAGKMEAFFREVTKTKAMPANDPALWLAHGMQLLGPPLQV